MTVSKHSPHSSRPSASTTLSGHDLTLAYDQRVVSEDLSVTIRPGSFTAIIGPNACGKSTLLRALTRLLPPRSGQVLIDGDTISSLSPTSVARRMALLPQSPVSPGGLTVRELVERGRFPYQSFLSQWSSQDDAAVERALTLTGIRDLADRQVDELSGGQRQRVWLALVLAQDTELLLLDEPTTYLDISHQLDVLNLCRSLQRCGRFTVVAVLHDLNLTFRYATDVLVMKEGRIVAHGPVHEVITADLIANVYSLPCVIHPDPLTGTPMVIPVDRQTSEGQ